jgi:hypothetical protein
MRGKREPFVKQGEQVAFLFNALVARHGGPTPWRAITKSSSPLPRARCSMLHHQLPPCPNTPSLERSFARMASGREPVAWAMLLAKVAGLVSSRLAWAILLLIR